MTALDRLLEACRELLRRQPKRLAEVNELQEIQPSLAGLQFADVRLGSVDGFGELGLCQTRFFTDLLEQVAESLMPR